MSNPQTDLADQQQGGAGDGGGDHAGQAVPRASASLRPDASNSR